MEAHLEELPGTHLGTHPEAHSQRLAGGRIVFYMILSSLLLPSLMAPAAAGAKGSGEYQPAPHTVNTGKSQPAPYEVNIRKNQSAPCEVNTGESRINESTNPKDKNSIRIFRCNRDNYRPPPGSSEEKPFRPGLEIRCNVDDAEVRFSGKKSGRTPSEWDNLPAGSYHVSLERSGYEGLEFWVEVYSGERTVVIAEMQRALGRLVLKSVPEGARIMINKTPITGVTEGGTITVPAGTSRISVTAFGWEDVEDTVTMAAGEQALWEYPGRPAAFRLQIRRVFPRSLPSSDARGFDFFWRASAPGSGRLQIKDASGTTVAERPLEAASPEGVIHWRPGDGNGPLQDGAYRVVLEGRGADGAPSYAEADLHVDSRFNRNPRPVGAPLPGLMHAPGTAMLPGGVWQAGVNIAPRLGMPNPAVFQSVPVCAGFRGSPAERWETGGRFGTGIREPFEDTSLFFSVYGAWRMNARPSFFSGNLALMFLYEAVTGSWLNMPGGTGQAELPGLQLSVPMEFAAGRFSFVATPALHLFFHGPKASERRLALPARAAASLAGGVYHEARSFLLGASVTLRSPDFQGDFLQWTLFGGLEGRLDFPGQGSYLALALGVNALNTPLVFLPSLEFGVIM